MIPSARDVFTCATEAVGIEPSNRDVLWSVVAPEQVDTAALALPAAFVGADAGAWGEVGAGLAVARRWLNSARGWTEGQVGEDDPLCGWLARRPVGGVALAGWGPLSPSEIQVLSAYVRCAAGVGAVREAVGDALALPLPDDGPLAGVVEPIRAAASVELARVVAGLEGGGGSTPVASEPADASHAIRDAMSYLRDALGWPRVAEIQRSGVAGVPGTRVARFFPVGLLLENLLPVEPEALEWCHALLREVGPGPIRYYEPWRAIPPDADSLGLALRLAARVRDAQGDPQAVLEALVRGWLVPLAPFAEGTCAPGTWLSELPEGAPGWMGVPCVAAQTSLAIGLHEWGSPRWKPLIRALVTDVASTWRGGHFDRVMFFRQSTAVRRWCELTAVLSPGERESLGVSEVTDALVEALVGSQGVRGSWASAQETAEVIHGLSLVRRAGVPVPPACVERGRRALMAAQSPDGSWDEEAFMVMPGPEGRRWWLKARDLTTAICASALGISDADAPG